MKSSILKMGDFMKVHLGYVAIPLSITNGGYFKTMTYTRYQSLSKEERIIKLDQIMTANLERFYQTLKYNEQNGVHFYRFSHNIVPLATHVKVHFNYIEPYRTSWEKIGEYVRYHHMRVDTHPDQYCVLNSENEEVVKNSKRILKFIDKIYQVMNMNSFMILHLGSGTPTKEEAKARFIKNFKKLPKRIREEIILENDDRTFHALDVLEICETLQIPMVIDIHHHYCHPCDIELSDLLTRVFKTWEGKSVPPKIHYSSPKNRKEKRTHHEYIDDQKFVKFLDVLKEINQDVDIMLECKAKDEALFRLIRKLKFYHNLYFIDQTTFEL